MDSALTMMLPEQFIDDFLYLDDWEERYGYIIDLGKRLPSYPAVYQVDAYLIPGCMSKLWMHATYDEDKVFYTFESDAMIVKGLCAVLFIIYNGKTPDEIVHYDISQFFSKTGLDKHITANRRSGFASLLTHIVKAAQSFS